MKGTHRGIGGAVAWLAGRLSLLLIVVATGASADARVVASTELSTIPERTLVAQGPSGGRRVDSHLMQASGAALSPTTLNPVATIGGDLMVVRLEEVALLSAMALDATPFAESRLTSQAPFETRKTATRASYGLPLPEPDGWTAVAATIALALFFFLRRLT